MTIRCWLVFPDVSKAFILLKHRETLTPVTQCHIPQDVNPRYNCCGNLEYCVITTKFGQNTGRLIYKDACCCMYLWPHKMPDFTTHSSRAELPQEQTDVTDKTKTCTFIKWNSDFSSHTIHFHCKIPVIQTLTFFRFHKLMFNARTLYNLGVCHSPYGES